MRMKKSTVSMVTGRGACETGSWWMHNLTMHTLAFVTWEDVTLIYTQSWEAYPNLHCNTHRNIKKKTKVHMKVYIVWIVQAHKHFIFNILHILHEKILFLLKIIGNCPSIVKPHYVYLYYTYYPKKIHSVFCTSALSSSNCNFWGIIAHSILRIHRGIKETIAVQCRKWDSTVFLQLQIQSSTGINKINNGSSNTHST